MRLHVREIDGANVMMDSGYCRNDIKVKWD